MKTHASILALAAVASGCDSGISFDAQPIVSVLKQDGECFALVAGEQVDPTLGISGVCSYRAEARLLAGIDFMEVIVDYGPDVPFAGTTTAPRPTISVALDGAPIDAELITISDEFRVGERAYYVGTFRAPTTPSSDVRITAGVNAGFQTIVPEVLANVAPPVSLVLLDCPSGSTTACQLAGGVGSAHIQVAVPGRISQLVTIHSELGGVPQPDPVPPVRTFLVGGRTEATTAIPVPVATPGTTWTISAQVGEAPASEVSATIRAPVLTARLTCGSTCALSSGDATGLEILAPAQIRPLEAFVTTRLDGVPQLVSARVELEPRADGFAVGLLGLTAPAGAGTWQVDVTVAGYAAPSVVTTVQ